MRGVVHHHGGSVEKFAGDAVMAVFGIPTVHEDDALRATRAAADMHAALGDLNEELWREWGVRLELHTGVNTGEVIAGDPGLSTSLVVGDAVNLAARLEQAAGPGQILLGRDTWSLVRDAVEVEPPRVLEIPGRRAGEPAYRLLAVRPGAAGRARRLDAPFVGRASELRLFRWAYERTATEAGLTLVTVLGGAGVGKTRLVLEATGGLEGRPALLLGRCLPYGNGSTFWPLAEVVRQAAGIGLEDPPEQARAKLAALLDGGAPDGTLVAERIGQLIGLEADPAPIEEAAWSTRRLLEVLAAERPLVVVFDDLHWAEPTFLDLVERLGDGGGDEAPILLVAVARPELLEQRPAWAGGRPNAVSMLLEPLGPDESGALLDGLAGGGPLPARARERIARAAGGNPLFIEELLAALVEEGRLRREAGAWVVAGDLAASGTPPTIQALVGARLDRLDGRDRDVLERAAVVGQAFESDTVAELSPPAARDEVPERLRGLVRREFLRTAPASLPAEAGYQFRHLLVRDAVYQAVPKQVRADLHERLAGLLEARAGARVREYEEIVGYHLEQAWRCRAELGPLDRRGHELGARAAGRLAAAGRRALARGDTPAATALLDRAVALLPAGHPRLALLLTDLADSLITTGDYRRGDQALTEALAAAGPDDAGLRAHVLITRLQMRLTTEPELEFEPLRRQVEEAIAVLERLGDERGLARAWRLLGYERFVQLPHRAGRAGDRQRHRARPAGRRRTAGGLRARHADRGRLLGPAARHRRHRALPPPAGRRRREPLRRGQRPLRPRRPGGHGGPLRGGPRGGGQGDGHRRDLRPRLPERRLQPVRRRGGAPGRTARRRRDAAGRRLPRPGAPRRDGRALQRGRRPGPCPARPGPRRRGRWLRRHQPVAGRPRGPLRPGPLARRHGPGAGRAGTRRRGRAAGPRGGDPGRAHRHAEPASGRPARPGRDGAGRRPARRRGRRHPRGAGAVRAQGKPGRRREPSGPSWAPPEHRRLAPGAAVDQDRRDPCTGRRRACRTGTSTECCSTVCSWSLPVPSLPSGTSTPRTPTAWWRSGGGSATWPAWPGTTPSSRAGSTRPACSSPTRSPACSGRPTARRARSWSTPSWSSP